MTVISLLHDGALRLEVAPAVMPAASFWIPLVPRDTVAAPGAAVVRVRASAGAAEAPGGPATLHVQAVATWLSGERASLAAASGLAGAVDLGAGRAELALPPADAGQGAADLASGLTLATGLLLGRQARALAHSGAVVGPDGRAWLLVGDSHAGKSTTTANLLQAGWRYVSDDQVVLFRGTDGGVWVEGWPRPFHLDAGWQGGAPVHRRGSIDPRDRWPGRWLRTAPLAGVLFPRVESDRPTARERVSAADALARLLRQSP